MRSKRFNEHGLVNSGADGRANKRDDEHANGLSGGATLYVYITSAKGTFHFGIFNRRNVYCFLSAVIQRLHSSPTLTNKLLSTYKTLDDLPNEEPLRSMMRPVFRYAMYNPKLNNGSAIYEGMRSDYEYLDNNIVDVNGRNGYVPNYLMVAAYLPLIYSMFPNDIMLIIQELNVTIIDFTNNGVEAKSLIMNDNHCFFRQPYRQRVYDLYVQMYAIFPEGELPSSSFAVAVMEVFPNKELTGGHAVTLIKTDTGEFYVIDDQSRINTLAEYIKQHRDHIYEISIRDIDAETIANINRILQAVCEAEQTFNARVTRWVLHFGNEAAQEDATTSDIAETYSKVTVNNVTRASTPGIGVTFGMRGGDADAEGSKTSNTTANKSTDSSESESGNKMWLYIGIGVGVLVIIGIIVAVVMSKRGSGKSVPPPAQMSAPVPTVNTTAAAVANASTSGSGTSSTTVSVIPAGIQIDFGSSNDASEGGPSVVTAGDTKQNTATSVGKSGGLAADVTSNKANDTKTDNQKKEEISVKTEQLGNSDYVKHAQALVDQIKPKFTDMSECLDALVKAGIDTKIKVSDVGVFSGMIDDAGQPYTRTLAEVCKAPPKEFQMNNSISTAKGAGQVNGDKDAKK